MTNTYSFDSCVDGNRNVFAKTSTEGGAESRIPVVIPRIRTAERDIVGWNPETLTCDTIESILP